MTQEQQHVAICCLASGVSMAAGAAFTRADAGDLALVAFVSGIAWALVALMASGSMFQPPPDA